MIDYRCKICGGKLSFSVNSGYAECENCGNTFEIDLKDLAEIRRVYESARRKIRLNSSASYKEAINELQTISFVSEAKESTALCKSRLDEIKAAEAKRAGIQEQTGKNDSKIGIVILILLLLVIAAAVAGAIFIGVHLYRGDLSPKAVTAIVSVVVILAVIVIIGKIKG